MNYTKKQLSQFLSDIKKIAIYVLFIATTLTPFSCTAKQMGTEKHLASCDFNGSVNSLHNCQAGLSCDSHLKICTLPSEIACSAKYKCPLGFKCMLEKSANANAGICVSDLSVSVESNSLKAIACKLLSFITGSVGRVIFIMFIGVIGSGFMFGKIEMQKVLMTFLGMSVVFGAGSLTAIFFGRGISCEENHTDGTAPFYYEQQ